MLPGLQVHVRRSKQSSAQSIKKILPGKYENVPYESYFVVKTIDVVSIMNLNIFEVHRKIVEVYQRDTRNTPQRGGSLISKVSSADKSDKSAYNM